MRNHEAVNLLSTAPRPVEEVPRWIDWGAVYGFLLHVASWEASAPGTPYLLTSRAAVLGNSMRLRMNSSVRLAVTSAPPVHSAGRAQPNTRLYQ